MSASASDCQGVVFLCHAAEDKAAVRELHERLHACGFAPWLDEDDLVPGQDWAAAIRRALGASAAVLVCLSPRTVSKTGFVQREIRYALDRAEEMPEGRIYIIPVILATCEIPERLSRYHCANLTHTSGFDRLVVALEQAGAQRRVPAPSVVLQVHRASFLATGQDCYFVNATNTTDHDVELTHVWFATEPATHVLQRDRPLPKRLRPQETWETWIPVQRLPLAVQDAPYFLARARLSTGTVAESRPNDTVPAEGFVAGGEVSYPISAAHVEDVLVAAAMVFVDIMRMLYTMTAPVARTANAHRFTEFIRMAEQHLAVLRTHIALHAAMLPQSQRSLVASTDRRLSGLVGKCTAGPKLNTRELRLCFGLAEKTAAALGDLGSCVPEYLALRADVHKLANEHNPATLDEYFRVRLEMQNRILGQRAELQTIADDMDLKLALAYCVIDQELCMRGLPELPVEVP